MLNDLFCGFSISCIKFGRNNGGQFQSVGKISSEERRRMVKDVASRSKFGDGSHPNEGRYVVLDYDGDKVEKLRIQS